MSDLLQIGSSALLAYQNALATTGHNIANVNTAGYTRQRVQLDARLGLPAGGGFVGDGVSQTAVVRLSDQFLTARLQADASSVSRESVYATLTGRVDQLLSDSSTGLSGALSAFFSAVDGMAANPADPAARSALIGAANTLANRFNTLQQNLDSLQNEISGRIGQDVTEINGLTKTIADLNNRIALAQASAGGQPPNDLLDRREQAIADLAGKIGITTVRQDDGSINVYAAGGQALVLGLTANALSARPSDGDSRGGVDVYIGSGSSAVNLTARLSGGDLGGLLDAQQQAIRPAQGELGRLAVALASRFNAIHRQGLDLNGAAGQDFFGMPTPEVTAYAANAGSAGVTAGYANAGALTGEDYLLRYDGSAWHLTSQRTGAEVALSGSGTAADPLIGGGLSLAVSGSASANDRYVIRSTSTASGTLRVLIGDPAKLAAAGPGTGSGDNTNAKALAELRTQGLLDGGSASVTQAYVALVAENGAAAQQAQLRSQAQAALQKSDAAARDAAAGVNLDEEAANMLKFQKAYQAAAQIIATAQAAFDSLLLALRR